jgi:hypothetical protein
MRINPTRMAVVIAALALAGGLLASAALANNLVYHPTHPTFGGDPNYATWLFGLANAQNQTTASGGSGSGSGGFDFGNGIGGPVIIINPGDNSVGSPSVEPSTEGGD